MSISYSNSFDTHIPVLTEAIKHLRFLKKEEGGKQSLRVLEVGIGYGSTPHLLKELNLPGDELISLENNKNWFDEFSAKFPKSASHIWMFAESWYHLFRGISKIDMRFDILFVDSSPWDSRTMALDFFSHRSLVVIVHDVDYFPHNQIWGSESRPIINDLDVGLRSYQDVLKSYQEVFPSEFFEGTGPPTLIGSNFWPQYLPASHPDSFVSTSRF